MLGNLVIYAPSLRVMDSAPSIADHPVEIPISRATSASSCADRYGRSSNSSCIFNSHDSDAGTVDSRHTQPLPPQSATPATTKPDEHPRRPRHRTRRRAPQNGTSITLVRSGWELPKNFDRCNRLRRSHELTCVPTTGTFHINHRRTPCRQNFRSIPPCSSAPSPASSPRVRMPRRSRKPRPTPPSPPTRKMFWRRVEGAKRLRGGPRHHLPGHLDRRLPGQLVEVRSGRYVHEHPGAGWRSRLAHAAEVVKRIDKRKSGGAHE